ncbi:DUF6114 domain-containing protein [Streptacidiphilus cavernicola]|uniref:DUF6114 domain-containing protein n=1 Tax=Streptacidiphilus cavernicola TaxID=3342716 RepID=A0ABV6W2H0_9ACTN
MTSATAQAQPEPGAGFSKARQSFRGWRRTRPFWGGLLVFLSGFPIIYFAYAALNVSGLHIQLATTAGASAAVIGLLLIALGVSVWFQPMVRVFAGIAAIILALISLPTANFGGFGLGLFPGLIGGALVCSWAPLKKAEDVTAELADGQEAESEEPEAKLTELLKPQAGPADAPEAAPYPAPGSEQAAGGHGGE